jgi:hypothetical protein
MPTKAANSATLLLPSGPPELQAPVEDAAKALCLVFPVDLQSLQLGRIGLFWDGGRGKQCDHAGKGSPQSAVGVIECQRTGMEQGKKSVAYLPPDRLVGHEHDAKAQCDE